MIKIIIVESLSDRGNPHLPAVFFPDGSVLFAPGRHPGASILEDGVTALILKPAALS